MNCCRKVSLDSLPVAVWGSSSTNTTSSGIHQRAILPCTTCMCRRPSVASAESNVMDTNLCEVVFTSSQPLKQIWFHKAITRCSTSGDDMQNVGSSAMLLTDCYEFTADQLTQASCLSHAHSITYKPVLAVPLRMRGCMYAGQTAKVSMRCLAIFTPIRTIFA